MDRTMTRRRAFNPPPGPAQPAADGRPAWARARIYWSVDLPYGVKEVWSMSPRRLGQDESLPRWASCPPHPMTRSNGSRAQRRLVSDRPECHRLAVGPVVARRRERPCLALLGLVRLRAGRPGRRRLAVPDRHPPRTRAGRRRLGLGSPARSTYWARRRLRLVSDHRDGLRWGGLAEYVQTGPLRRPIHSPGRHGRPRPTGDARLRRAR